VKPAEHSHERLQGARHGHLLLLRENDVKGKDFAKMLESKLHDKDKEGKAIKKHQFIGVVEMPKTKTDRHEAVAENAQDGCVDS